jgi:hypothetical protein
MWAAMKPEAPVTQTGAAETGAAAGAVLILSP